MYSERVETLLSSLGLNAASFGAVLKWVLCEHLVRVLRAHPVILERGFFTLVDAMRRYAGVISSLPVHGNKVKAPYIKRLRKAWGISADDGVSDDDFREGKWE